MRYNILKKHSTKTERVIYEILKELRIPFRHRWIIEGYEIDFVIGKVCLEIDGHEQSGDKNSKLANKGYIPLHLDNNEIKGITKTYLINILKNYGTN